MTAIVYRGSLGGDWPSAGGDAVTDEDKRRFVLLACDKKHALVLHDFDNVFSPAITDNMSRDAAVRAVDALVPDALAQGLSIVVYGSLTSAACSVHCKNSNGKLLLRLARPPGTSMKEALPDLEDPLEVADVIKLMPNLRTYLNELMHRNGGKKSMSTVGWSNALNRETLSIVASRFFDGDVSRIGCAQGGGGGAVSSPMNPAPAPAPTLKTPVVKKKRAPTLPADYVPQSQRASAILAASKIAPPPTRPTAKLTPTRPAKRAQLLDLYDYPDTSVAVFSKAPVVDDDSDSDSNPDPIVKGMLRYRKMDGNNCYKRAGFPAWTYEIPPTLQQILDSITQMSLGDANFALVSDEDLLRDTAIFYGRDFPSTLYRDEILRHAADIRSRAVPELPDDVLRSCESISGEADFVSPDVAAAFVGDDDPEHAFLNTPPRPQGEEQAKRNIFAGLNFGKCLKRDRPSTTPTEVSSTASQATAKVNIFAGLNFARCLKRDRAAIEVASTTPTTPKTNIFAGLNFAKCLERERAAIELASTMTAAPTCKRCRMLISPV